MYQLRSIDPLSGFSRCFDLSEDGPLLIGRLTVEGAIEHLKSLISGAPPDSRQALAEEIRRTQYTITMKECRIDQKTVSRAHCMIFPGSQPQIMDLFSTNGTTLARSGAGIVLNPGEMTDLEPGDLILLAKGAALFCFVGPCANNSPSEVVPD